MSTIWGNLYRIEGDKQGRRWLLLKATVSRVTTIRIRALVGKDTLIARGIERVDLSSLRAGELVEVSYHQSRDGFMEAETVYVHPEQISVG